MIGIARRTVCNLARSPVARRGLQTSKALRNEVVEPGYKNVKKVQESFVEDGNPVHLKGGPLDNVLFGVTAVACAAGVVWDCIFYFELSMK